MSARPCTSPIAFPVLVDYWFGELAGAREEALEEHFFGCAHCAARLQELAALARGVREAFRAGAVRAVLSSEFVERIKAEGLRVREYRIAPGGSVNCTISAADHFVVSRLSAPLAGVTRVDVYESAEELGMSFAYRDVPFDPAAGEVLVFPPAAALKKLPAHVARMRLVAVDEAGERTLGVYTFNHAPS